MSKSEEYISLKKTENYKNSSENLLKNLIKNEEKTDKTYTIVISTYDRDHELIKNIDHWLSCPHIYQLQVLWHDPDREPPKLLKEMVKEYDCSEKIPKDYAHMEKYYNFKRLNIRVQKKNLLTNRFKIPKNGFKTEGIFNIDDDAVMDCRLMTKGFKNWNNLGYDSLVGFEPRQINWNIKNLNENEENKEGNEVKEVKENDNLNQGYTWYASCESNSCKYNTLWPTKGAFLHNILYEIYFTEEYKKPRELVDNYLTGEDILMTYVHYSYFYKKNNKVPSILAIQATKNFKREFFNYHQRYTTIEKITLLPAYIMDLLYIDEIGSLGLRSSWFRHHITESIGELANNTFSKSITPPMVEEWCFVEPDLTTKLSSNVCQDKELFKALRCTTYTSLYPVSFRDLALYITILSFIVFLLYLAYRVKKYQNERFRFERVRQRKASGADINDFYS